MKMVLPLEGYRSASDFMEGLQGTQGDMFWLYKQQGHWHGGIHFFDSFAANAVWQTGSQTGLKSMTDGKVVAWRLNDAYPTIDYKNRPHKFSSTFLLIKSTCTPDTSKPDHALDFYTLWMQIAPLEEYKEDGLQKATVTASHLNIREDNPLEGWVRTGLTDAEQTLTEEEKAKYAAPVKKDVSVGLPKNSVVELIKEATFLLDGEPAPFAFVRIKSLPARARSGASVDETVWISARPEHLKRQEPYLPEWMKKARDKGEFNKVVLPEEEIIVKAGDIIGHLSYLERPDNSAHRFCHLEVFSQDSRFLDFLNNKAGVTVGEALIQYEAGKKRYSFDERSNTFSVIAVGDDPTLTTAERYTAKGQVQIKEVEGKKWYLIAQENAWLAADDVAVVNQYDLTKRGFIPLEQNELPQTVTQTPGEGWLHKVFQRLRQLAEENRADLYSSGYIEGYKRLLRQMDSNRDGVLSESEVWQFLHNRQPHILNQVHRFVVKHHSEWLRDGMSELWRTALADQAETNPELAVYLRKFIDALVWMKDVPEIHSGEALWHMHPVVFLDALAEKYLDVIEFQTSLGIYRISRKSAEFILSWEAYVAKPYVPGGDNSSGVTVGYGYDLGQQNLSSARSILSNYYTHTQVDRLLVAVGKKGDQARNIVNSLSDITISKAKALDMAMVLKQKYCQIVVNTYPQAIDLPPDSAGAILSLVYNRGGDLSHPRADDSIDRRREMREIRDDFQSGNLEKIPGRLRSMKRLWPNQRGLVKRREGEAVLIENDLISE